MTHDAPIPWTVIARNLPEHALNPIVRLDLPVLRRAEQICAATSLIGFAG